VLLRSKYQALPITSQADQKRCSPGINFSLTSRSSPGIFLNPDLSTRLPPYFFSQKGNLRWDQPIQNQKCSYEKSDTAARKPLLTFQ